MPRLDRILHILFSLYFFIRILFANPFIPTVPQGAPQRSYLRLLLLSAFPPTAFLCFSTPDTIWILSSYSFAVLYALRYALHYPRSHEPTTDSGLLGLYFWRADTLFYFVFACLSSVMSRPTVFSVPLFFFLALIAILTNLKSLCQRAVYSYSDTSIRTLIRIAFPLPNFSQLWRSLSQPSLHLPPTVFNASAYSLLSFEYITPVVAAGRRRALEDPDVPPLSENLRSTAASNRFQALWSKEIEKRRIDSEYQPRLVRTIATAFGGRFFAGGLLKLCEDFSVFTAPLLLRMVRFPV